MNLREAAQKALASMDQMLEGGEWYCAKERADALRAALAENERDWSLLEATQESLREHMAEIKTLRDSLEQADKPKTIAEWWAKKQTASGEPVAWIEGPHGAIRANRLWKLDPMPPQSVAWSIPLYATAPVRVPLTDEQIDE